MRLYMFNGNDTADRQGGNQPVAATDPVLGRDLEFAGHAVRPAAQVVAARVRVPSDARLVGVRLAGTRLSRREPARRRLA